MRFWFDTEFIEDGVTVDLISIGMVAEDGRTFYKLNYDCHFERANTWVRQNVLAHIPNKPALFGIPDRSCDGNWLRHSEIRDALLGFVGNDPEPEFWADFASYDWVAMCQLFGPMIALPKGWPMFVRDVQQLRKYLGVSKDEMNRALAEVNDPDVVIEHPHHALSDAYTCKRRWEYLTNAGNR